MTQREEARNRDLLFLMMWREPGRIKRLMKRWLWCLR